MKKVMRAKLNSGMKACLAALLLLVSVPAFAGESGGGQPAQPSNLTLGNFFTEGWNQEWVKRHTPGGAPDMSLLHVQTNFLEREFRTNFSSQQNVGSNKISHVTNQDALIAYGINRRFMIEVVGNYQWNSAATGASSSGASAALLGRLQLVDVPGASYAYNLKVSSPNSGIGTNTTTFTNALAGWNDLTPLGLKKVGLYYSIQENAYDGPVKTGGKHNDLAWATALAKTWTDPHVPVLGGFTTFVEGYGSIDLDGSAHNKTFNITPGFHTKLGHDSLGHEHVLMAGVDLPVGNPHQFNTTYRVTYVFDF